MQITKTLYVHWQAQAWHENGGMFSVWDMNMKDSRGFGEPVAIKEVTFEVPEIDPRERLIDVFQKERAQIIAEATERAKHLDEKIQELLALPAGKTMATPIDDGIPF